MKANRVRQVGSGTVKRTDKVSRRSFLSRSLTIAGGCAICIPNLGSAQDKTPAKALGKGRGIHPGRVVWVYDPNVTDWTGVGDGHWWEPNRVKQDHVDTMMLRAVCDLTGESSTTTAWTRLFRHLNQSRGRGDAGYKPGQRILIKPNWVGMIYHEGHVNLETCTFSRRHDYMNTGPQMLIALIRQLVAAGVHPGEITICDTLACLVKEYYDILHAAYPDVRYEDYLGKQGRTKVKESTEPLYWSSRPEGKTQDFVPSCFAEADYLINFANLKAHTGGGVTLCAKNHYGSLVRWPVQKGYYDMHPNCFSKETAIYRPLVDLLGHSHLGGKTVLNLVDGLFSGIHPKDPAPQRMRTQPFNGGWSSSLLASQDPVAIDSVGLDFLAEEWPDVAGKSGVDDYLHEAAQADNPPSGTFYDPNHASGTRKLPSLGVHEHWNNPVEKKYSRNQGMAEGIELVSVKL